MRRRIGTKLLVAGALVALACVGDETAVPTQPGPVVVVLPATACLLNDATAIDGEIAALYPNSPDLRGAALAQFSSVKKQCTKNPADAQSKAIRLAGFAAKKFLGHQLLGTATAIAVSAHMNHLYVYVGVTAPGDLTGALSTGAGVAVVAPSDPTTDVVTDDRKAGVRIPPGAISTTQTVLVTVTPTANQASPLPTSLTQYGPFYDFTTYPDVPAFNQPVTIGICVNLTGVLAAVQSRLQLAYPAAGGGVTIGARAPTPFLGCSPLPLASRGGASWERTLLGWARGLFRPAPLHAGGVVELQAQASGGAGTQPSTFSPDACNSGGAGTLPATFCSGAVDPNSQVVFTGQPSATAPGAPITPAVQLTVETSTGQPITTFQGTAAVAILFNAAGGTLTGTLTQPVVNGVATFADLKIDNLGTGYTLAAAATSSNSSPTPRTGASAAFNIITTACDCWTPKAPMPTARGHLGIGVVNGILYAIGGNSASGYTAIVEAYDPVTNTWTTKAPMPTARGYLSVGVVNGILYAVGGASDAGGDLADLATVEAYDPVTNTWTTKASMPTARYLFGVGVVNGVLYAVGGFTLEGTDRALATVEAYDPVANAWTTKASMPRTTDALGVGVVNGVLYAVGGEGQTEVDAYDAVANSWTIKAPIPGARAFLGVGVVNGALYAVGGISGSVAALPKVEAYDPLTNTWTTKAGMPTARAALGVGVVNGFLYAVGGESPLGSYGWVSANEAYRP